MAKRPFIQLLFALAVLCLTSTTLLAAPPPMRVEATFRQPDGMILVAGQATSGAQPRSFVVARMMPNGQWDPGFPAPGGGFAEYPIWQAMTDLRVTAIATQPDGKILVAAQVDGRLALVRFEMMGTPDFTFGNAGPGMQLDYDVGAMRVNAFLIQPFGEILGIGSYTPSGGAQTAAAVRHYAGGMRDWSFGTGTDGVRTYQLTAAESELRAIVPTATGYAAVGNGRQTSTSLRKMLVAAFQPDGLADYMWGNGGWVLNDVFWGGDAEATTIRTDAMGRLLLVGANGHQFNGSPQSALNVVALNSMGQWDYYWSPTPAYGQVPIPGPFDGNATAVSLEPIPGGEDYLVAGSVIEIATGRSHFAIWRIDRDYQEPYAWGPLATPIAVEDDVMSNAFITPDGQILAIGTRESVTGDSVVRIRYFADNGEFDTVVTDTEDTTPNPFAYEPYGLRVGSGFSAASQPVRISGINTATPISVTGGEYVLNCDYFGAWTSDPGYIYNGQKVCVRVTAATTPDTTRTVTLNVGGVEAGYSLTTGFVPDTLIDAKPSNPGISTANFTYRRDMESGGDATYECRLDSASFASCPLNGITYTGLAVGQHTFEVRASNEWGQDQTPASYTWTVAELPQTTVDSAPAYYINVTTATVTFSSPDAGATFQCSLNGAAYANCASPKTYTGLAVGGYTFNVRAVNAVGTDPTPAQAQWIIDTTAPDTSIASGLEAGALPYGVRSFEVFLASNEISSHFQYSLNGGPFVDTSSPVYLSNLADGYYTFAARAIDPHGNIDATPVTRNFTVEATPPVTLIFSGPSGTTSQTTAAFQIGPGGNVHTFDCTLDGVAIACASSPPVQFTGLAEGTHVFAAAAKKQVRDVNGNTVFLADPTPATRTWVVDFTAPQTTISSGPAAATASTSATFEFGSSEGASTFVCSLDGAAYTACSSPVAYNGLAIGAHSFSVAATDAVGNADQSPATWSWVVDTMAPGTTIDSGPSGTVKSTTATFTFSASEQQATFECKLDSGAFAACTSPKTYTGLPKGIRNFQVRAIDAAGNVDASAASRSWRIN